MFVSSEINIAGGRRAVIGFYDVFDFALYFLLFVLKEKSYLCLFYLLLLFFYLCLIKLLFCFYIVVYFFS